MRRRTQSPGRGGGWRKIARPPASPGSAASSTSAALRQRWALLCCQAAEFDRRRQCAAVAAHHLYLLAVVTLRFLHDKPVWLYVCQHRSHMPLQVRQLRWQVQQQGGKLGGAGSGVPPSGGRASSAAGRLNSPAKGGR